MDGRFKIRLGLDICSLRLRLGKGLVFDCFRHSLPRLFSGDNSTVTLDRRRGEKQKQRANCSVFIMSDMSNRGHVVEQLSRPTSQL